MCTRFWVIANLQNNPWSVGIQKLGITIEYFTNQFNHYFVFICYATSPVVWEILESKCLLCQTEKVFLRILISRLYAKRQRNGNPKDFRWIIYSKLEMMIFIFFKHSFAFVLKVLRQIVLSHCLMGDGKMPKGWKSFGLPVKYLTIMIFIFLILVHFWKLFIFSCVPKTSTFNIFDVPGLTLPTLLSFL